MVNLLKKGIRLVMDSLETVTFIGSIYMVIYLFLFQPGMVKGASMEPTLHTNERFITSKVSYRLHQPERGDVVVIHSPQNYDIEFIKRVIALPGESLELRDGEVYINGNRLKEPYISSKTHVFEGEYVKEAVPLKIPPKYIFVMGDNRDRSLDSRSFGPIPISSIVGQAVYRYSPSDKIGTIPPSH